jgi:hypothetical protein
MVTVRHLLLVVSPWLALGSCSKPRPRDDAAVVARAQAALGPFKTALKTELTQALAKGPEAAIDVCAERAPALARENSKDGVLVGRSALKLRNPANAPPAWLAPVMDDLSKTPSGSSEHRVVSLPGGRSGYAEPIWIQPPCLVCHGEHIAPALEAKLRERYPSDAARGFRVGDFRGVFYAELDAPKP